MTNKRIKELAIEAGMPRGWYEGPWFDDKGNFNTGMSPCLVKFVALVVKEANQ